MRKTVLYALLLAGMISCAFTSDASANSEQVAAQAKMQREVKAAVEAAFGKGSIMVAVARCESHFQQFNLDGTLLMNAQGVDALGIFQIRWSVHGDFALSLGYDIRTQQGNIDYAKYLKKHQKLRPWKSTATCWG